MKIFESHSIHREKNVCAREASPVAASPAKERPAIRGVVLAALALGLAGCSESANLPTAPSSGKVQTYFAGPIQNTYIDNGQMTIDHYGGQLSFEIVYNTGIAPFLEGTYTATAAGFTNITETAGMSGNGGTSIVTMPTPATGAWLVEIPGVAATGNLLYTINGTIQRGAATLMAANTECPNFPSAAHFLFVSMPAPNSTFPASNYYGTADIVTQGSSVDFNSNYYTLGQPLANPTTFQGDAACATTAMGSLISYPVNFVGSGNYGGYATIAKSQFLAGGIPLTLKFNNLVQYVVGVVMPSSAVSTTALASTHYIGLIYYPTASSSSGAAVTYDPGVLAGAFGDEAGTSLACSSFQTEITASLASKTISQAPSTAAIYGGDFSKALTNGAPGASGTETCDMAIDLGTQDSTNNGLFPSAQLYVAGSTTVTSATGAAIVSQIDGRSVILFRTPTRLIALFQALQ